jgi:hypothetical protein
MRVVWHESNETNRRKWWKLKMGRTGYLPLKFEIDILELTLQLILQLILQSTSWLILSINDNYDEQKIKLSERKKNI